MLIDQQPSLISHIQKQHDLAGRNLFEDANAWVALSDIFTSVLQDPSLKSTYLIIDALDECVIDLPKLLDFIVQKSCVSPNVKWLVSSRNNTDIERKLWVDDSGMRLSLDGACGSTFVSRLMPDGGTRRVHIPGVSDSVGLVGASGDKLVVVGQVGCGGGTSLLTYDPGGQYLDRAARSARHPRRRRRARRSLPRREVNRIVTFTHLPD